MYYAPMLCNAYEDKKVVFPSYVQPKLNGIRCLDDGRDPWTRNLKPHKPHIQLLLDAMGIVVPTEMVLDGELILPAPYTFQDTQSAVRREQELSAQLEFHVFDCFFPNQPNMPFTERFRYLGHLTGFCRVETVEIFTVDDIHIMHKAFEDDGYEGIIYRTAGGKYHHGSCGRDLLKLKNFMDAEYPIIAVWEGKDKFAGMAVFRMPCPWYKEGDPITEKNSFGATAPGKFPKKRYYWEHRDEYIGKPLTVKFQNLSDDGVPIFPTSVAVRDYE